ncbi:MAG TPA: hypothetical protein DIT15_14320, partial [Arthrobacter bacterium]|nr:hypothetical protein [Arthrobacter sp.]
IGHAVKGVAQQSWQMTQRERGRQLPLLQPFPAAPVDDGVLRASVRFERFKGQEIHIVRGSYDA